MTITVHASPLAMCLALVVLVLLCAIVRGRRR